MLTPPRKWMCVFFCFSVSFKPFSMSWQFLETYILNDHRNLLKHGNEYFIISFSNNSQSDSPYKLLTCKSDNCFAFPFLLWWSWLYFHPGTWVQLSASKLQHNITLHASLLSMRNANAENISSIKIHKLHQTRQLMQATKTDFSWDVNVTCFPIFVMSDLFHNQVCSSHAFNSINKAALSE